MTITDPSKFERHANGYIKKGSGGRVAGSRNKLQANVAFPAPAIDLLNVAQKALNAFAEASGLATCQALTPELWTKLVGFAAQMFGRCSGRPQ